MAIALKSNLSNAYATNTAVSSGNNNFAQKGQLSELEKAIFNLPEQIRSHATFEVLPSGVKDRGRVIPDVGLPLVSDLVAEYGFHGIRFARLDLLQYHKRG